MRPSTIVILVLLAIIIIGFIALYFYAKKMEKKSSESKAQMQAASQTVSMLVIDKKRMKMKDAKLPQIVIDQTPKYLRRAKLPIVKAKVGPKVITLISDEKIFDLIPIKKEIKAVISGIYIMEVKAGRGGLETPPPKVGFFKRVKNKVMRKASS